MAFAKVIPVVIIRLNKIVSQFLMIEDEGKKCMLHKQLYRKYGALSIQF